MLFKQEFIVDRLNYNLDNKVTFIFMLMSKGNLIGCLGISIRAYHVNSGQIRQGVGESKRIGHLASEDEMRTFNRLYATFHLAP